MIAWYRINSWVREGKNKLKQRKKLIQATIQLLKSTTFGFVWFFGTSETDGEDPLLWKYIHRLIQVLCSAKVGQSWQTHRFVSCLWLPEVMEAWLLLVYWHSYDTELKMRTVCHSLTSCYLQCSPLTQKHSHR